MAGRGSGDIGYILAIFRIEPSGQFGGASGALFVITVSTKAGIMNF